MFNLKKMTNQKNQKQRPIDQTVSRASQSLSRRFVLASKTQIKAWKAFVVIMFVAGFAAALVWSAYNSWYIGSEAKKKSAPVFSAPDKKDLAAYWSFDEDDNRTARDKSGNGNDGTMYDVKKCQGKSKEGLDFNGTGAYVKVPDSKSLDITDQLTLEAWIFPEEDKNQGAYLDGIIAKGGLWDGGASYQLYYNPRSSKVTGVIRWGKEKKDHEWVTIKVDQQKWSHVALTLDGNGDIKLWVDGIPVRAKKLPQDKKMQASDFDVNIGGAYPHWFKTRYFHGKIDEARIYKRALSEGEIRRHAGLNPLKLKKLVHVGDLVKDEKGKDVSLNFDTLGKKGADILKDVTKSPFDGYAVKVVKNVAEMCKTGGIKVPEMDDLAAGIKTAKEYEKMSRKDIWPLVNWSIWVPCAPAGCCNGDNCSSCEDDAMENEGAEGEAAECGDGGKKCCRGDCEYATAINPWDESAADNFVELHKRAFQISKELGVEGIMIDPEFYRDHKNYSVEYIRQGLAKKGIVKSREEIENELKQIGRRIAGALEEVYGNRDGVALWMFFGNVTELNTNVVKGIMEKAKNRVRVIDGGEHLLRYVHSSEKELACTMEERDKAMSESLKRHKNVLSLGGTAGLYLKWNEVQDIWETKIKQACKHEKKCGIANKECPEVKTVDDAVPLLRKLFSAYEYVWIYRGHGVPPFGETDPDMKSADREKFRAAVVKARGTCGNSACEEIKGENKNNCPADCGGDKADESENLDEEF